LKIQILNHFGIVDENGELTNAGALLADESPIRHSRLFCTRWNGLDKAPGVIDAADDKEYMGGLINLLQDGIDFVTNNSKKMWKKTGDGRLEMPDYPQQAVLEGLVNAIIHRNYLEIGSEVHIDMFDDRTEIFSPGGMYDGSKVQDRDIMQIPSRRRNPVIADIFNRLKYMERRGSGFKKIMGDYKKQLNYAENKEPKFFSDNDSFLTLQPASEHKSRAAAITRFATAPSLPKKLTMWALFFDKLQAARR
jgi:ATP-dependent DNA helicase RecG